MAHAYTPGLRVTANTALRRTRRLPLKGEVLVAEGDHVRRDQVVARTDLPGDVVTLNIVNRLGISAEEIPRYMLKSEGDVVSVGEILAEVDARRPDRESVARERKGIAEIVGCGTVRGSNPVQIDDAAVGFHPVKVGGPGVRFTVRGGLVGPDREQVAVE